MAKPGRTTQEKRRRELKKIERRQDKDLKREERKKEKELNPKEGGEYEDPDLIGIVPGPQPHMFD